MLEALNIFLGCTCLIVLYLSSRAIIEYLKPRRSRWDAETKPKDEMVLDPQFAAELARARLEAWQEIDEIRREAGIVPASSIKPKTPVQVVTDSAEAVKAMQEKTEKLKAMADKMKAAPWTSPVTSDLEAHHQVIDRVMGQLDREARLTAQLYTSPREEPYPMIPNSQLTEFTKKGVTCFWTTPWMITRYEHEYWISKCAPTKDRGVGTYIAYIWKSPQGWKAQIRERDLDRISHTDRQPNVEYAVLLNHFEVVLPGEGSTQSGLSPDHRGMVDRLSVLGDI